MSWNARQLLRAVLALREPTTLARNGKTVFFIYTQGDVKFIVQARAISHAGISTYSLTAFWPREDCAQDFDSHGAVGSTNERYVRECFEGSPEALASLIGSDAMRPLATIRFNRLGR